ncbi:integral membrane protein CcmA involved in cell shape determination [Methanoculleus sediminis]|uniref:Integral membrane protein CcmA involved in cell shape determination n=1 Tax=Methanoculleus sediminis TaxID=1550566 RepID=A0A0H1QYR1_9EURY|nr:integral membrane protein CcmA involved in cell shape determination [Methanoculleus sediminis]
MKVYRHGDTYIAPKGSFFDGNVKIDGNFITPPETHVWGNMVVAGRLELGPGSTVGGFIEAESIVIGHDAKIKGPIRVLETATICDNASLHSVKAGGNVTLRPGVSVGAVNSDETIFVYGKVTSERLFGRAVKIYGT